MMRSCRLLWTGRQIRYRLAAYLAAATVAWTAVAAATAAPKAPAPAPEPAVEVVVVEGGRLTVDVRGSELSEVLHQVGEAAGFHLTTTGELGLVTAAFSARTVEEGLRRLVQDHEMMLVYRPVEVEGEPAKLVEVQVFASAPARRVVAGPRDATLRTEAIREITALIRSRPGQGGVPRLAQLLATSPDAAVRGRAVRGLGVLGGPAATGALSGALRDEAAFVRVQAAQALRRVAGVEAIPALSGLLTSDPDVSVRRTAARALGTLRSPDADATLSAMANDPDRMIRAEARRALDRQNALSR